jgi:hypothetical protein
MQKFFSRPIFGALAVSLISFIVYLQTMQRSVPFIDGGELATVCATLGIAHPTGYPIFCLLGYLFAHLPIAGQVILRVNMMSAFFCALGSGAMVFFISELYLYWFNKRKAKLTQQKGKKVVAKPLASEEIITDEKRKESIAAGIFAGLAMAFSATWWDTSNSVEVYPIHCFLVPIILTFFFRMLRLEKEKFGKNSILFAFTLGLSFSNHLTTILLAPACLYMFFATYGFKKNTFIHIAKLAIPFFLGLLPYLYFPIRASQFPLMDWGHPVDLHSFWKHFTGGQYSIMMFTKDAPKMQWPYFWGKYPGEFTIAGLALVLAGIWALFTSLGRGKAHLLVFVILLFFGCLLWSMNFEILEINPYFLTAYIASVITITFGIVWILQQAKGNIQRQFVPAILATGVIFSGIEIFAHHKEVDESGNYFVEDYTKNMLRNLPKDAIIFTSAWDFWASGAFYYQLVENIRPDVFVIDVAMLHDRPWYFNHLKQRFPEVMKRVEPELSAFMVHLVRFDHDPNYDKTPEGGEGLSRTYQVFTEALVSKNFDRPLFLSPEVLSERNFFSPSYKIYPAGLAYQLLPHDSTFDVPLPVIEWHDQNYRERSYYTDHSRSLQAMALVDRAKLLIKQSKIDEAKKFLDLALSYKPDMNADIEKLHGRDKETAYQTNSQFANIEEMRKALGK